MRAGTTAAAERGDTASFELERFELTAPDRLEVAGRWFGVRGLRFMRPALDLRASEDRHRLLALLEHKPWAAEDGEEWVAAFPWEGDPVEFTEAELAVGPSVAVELPLPGARGQAAGRSRKAKPRTRGGNGGGRKSSSRSPARATRVRAGVSNDRALAEARQLREERDAALAARQAAVAERDAALADRDAAVAARDAAMAAMAERDEAIAGRGAALRAREIAVDERDAARLAIDEALRQRQAAIAERDAAQRQRDAAVRERDEAWRKQEELRARLDEALAQRGAPARPAAPSAWTARAVVLGALAIVVIWVAAAVIRALI